MGVICDSDRLLAIELHYNLHKVWRNLHRSLTSQANSYFQFLLESSIVFGQDQEPNQQTLLFIGAGWLPVVVHGWWWKCLCTYMYMYLYSSFLIERGAGKEVRPSPKQMSTDLPYYLWFLKGLFWARKYDKLSLVEKRRGREEGVSEWCKSEHYYVCTYVCRCVVWVSGRLVAAGKKERKEGRKAETQVLFVCM
jgi:hypothetical protein